MKRATENTHHYSEHNTKKIKTLNLINADLLKGLNIYILPSRFGPKRLEIFKTNVCKFGGSIFNGEDTDKKYVTHIVVEETVDKNGLLKICNVGDFINAKFVTCLWLSKCFNGKTLIPIEQYIIFEPTKSVKSISTKPFASTLTEATNTEQKLDLSQISSSTSINLILEPNADSDMKNTQSHANEFIEKFACAHSSNTAPTNLNEHITSELEKLSSAYESRKDTWRAVGYHKAVAAIKSYPKTIETWEEAKSIRGVGERLADKIKEILDSGTLRKAEQICENEETKILQLFTNVWGAGPTTANIWYTQGFRTLDDLKTKANLTRHQQIGLKYYYEFIERIPRPEVQEIEHEVRCAAESIKSGVKAVVCGSYRRGKSSCGDVDILITHPDGVSHENIFKPLLEKLTQSGFLTDDLVIQENNGNQQKYLGVCKVAGEGRLHRRLDIIVVPFSEYAPAIMYFTGSAHFNRSMRLLATKLGMSLSEHGLRAGIVRDGKGFVTGGTLLQTTTEEDIFHHLGLPYRAPSERNH